MEKNSVKKIPGVVSLYRFFRGLIYSQARMTRMIFRYNQKRFYKYSGAFNASKGKDLAYLTWFYHTIEKGLAMPGMRLGFGQDKIVKLNEVIDSFIEKYGSKDTPLQDAISVLFEYDDVHKAASFPLPANVQDLIERKRKQYPEVAPLRQKWVTKEEYFSRKSSDFRMFSLSRHSVRDFSGKISMDQLTGAVDLARNCPSACNRQPSRVHIVSDKTVMKECLSLQNGNRGFGDLADKLLVVTGDLSTVLGAQEFFDLNTNVGIFVLNLSYALHYHEVAHCILNWYVLPKEDKKLRRLLSIPDREAVVCFILCGNLPDQFKLVSSPRMKAEEMYTIH